jgi:hypothetical protein
LLRIPWIVGCDSLSIFYVAFDQIERMSALANFSWSRRDGYLEDNAREEELPFFGEDLELDGRLGGDPS